ncbi:MAG: alpha/beta fold hydrolase [Opitutales bacterium]
MPRFTVLVILHLFSVSHGLCTAEFSEISFETDDDATIYANLYGTGEYAVNLAHGAIFNKESWHALSTALTEDGLQVLAIDFRGYGKSKPGSRSSGMYLDLLAGI